MERLSVSQAVTGNFRAGFPVAGVLRVARGVAATLARHERAQAAARRQPGLQLRVRQQSHQQLVVVVLFKK